MSQPDKQREAFDLLYDRFHAHMSQQEFGDLLRSLAPQSSIGLPSISPELREVLTEYDTIVRKGDFDPAPEWDFVMRRADYRLMREVLRKLPILIVNPPKPA